VSSTNSVVTKKLVNLTHSLVEMLDSTSYNLDTRFLIFVQITHFDK